MRHLAWLSGLVLVISCSVNPVQNPDGSAAGSGGKAGTTPTGGGGQGGTTVTGGGGQAGTTPTGGGQGGTTFTGGGGQAGTAPSGGGGQGGTTVTGGGGSGGQGGTMVTGGGGQAGTTVTGSGGQAGTSVATGGTGGGSAGRDGTAGGGGSAGHPADAGESCAQIETEYGNALTGAVECSPGATGQCQHLVDTSLSCKGCKRYVNNVTELNALSNMWMDQNCAATFHPPCPAIACLVPGPATCAATNGTSGGPNAGAGPGGSCTSMNVTNNSR